MKKRAVLLGFLIGSASACGFDSAPTGQAVCVEGQSAECACDDGARGLHTCSQGEFGACRCAPAGGASPGGVAPDGAGGSSAGGSSGGSTAGTEPGVAGHAGTGTEPNSGAAGSNSLDAGSGGASAGSGGSGVAGSAAAGAAGGAAGAAGSTGSDAGSGGDDVPLPPAKPGTPYGACAAQGECQDGMLCFAINANGGTTGGYCAPPCTIGGSGGLVACPQPKSGQVQAQCAAFLSVCLLAACEGQDCPSGMECVETDLALPQQSGLHDCRYPVSP
jgi:hypothetical protein